MKAKYCVSVPLYYKMLGSRYGIHLASLCEEHGIKISERETGTYNPQLWGKWNEEHDWKWKGFKVLRPNTNLRYFVGLYGLAQCIVGWSQYTKSYRSTSTKEFVEAWEWVFAHAEVDPAPSTRKYIKKKAAPIFKRRGSETGWFARTYPEQYETLRALAEKGEVA